eukprot:TRINITY_DN7368_c0_g1_i1.p1 TRINITY_DN7368_c0_g1~~TRINITY_DN7368_c0_g1_i1.p1  ORF type:complete len:284 (+),score=45.47 TRINITY_DN7368_c0_g1_i1:62-853(+)
MCIRDSDYTLGVRGIGIVNAIEIVNVFETEEALQRFREWAQAPDILLDNIKEHYTNVPLKEIEYKASHRNYKKQWELPDSFPNRRVIEAYLHPNIDESKEKFTWGTPDIEKLKLFCQKNFEWDERKISEHFDPLVKVIEEHKFQPKITDYFTKQEKFAIINSKRIKEAVKGLRGEYIPKDGASEEKNTPVSESLDEIFKMQKRVEPANPDQLLNEFTFKKKRPSKKQLTSFILRYQMFNMLILVCILSLFLQICNFVLSTLRI